MLGSGSLVESSLVGLMNRGDLLMAMLSADATAAKYTWKWYGKAKCIPFSFVVERWLFLLASFTFVVVMWRFWYVYFFGWQLIVIENQWLRGINSFVVGSGHSANTVRRELVCPLGVGYADYSLRWRDTWLPGLRCPDEASKEDRSCPAVVACLTLTVGEVCGISSILEMDSSRHNISPNSSYYVVCAKKFKLQNISSFPQVLAICVTNLGILSRVPNHLI